MKVLVLLHYPEFGGPHNQVLRLHRPLLKRGFTIIAVLPEGPGAERLRAGGVMVKTMKIGRFRAVKSPLVQVRMLGRFPVDLWNLWNIMRSEQPDIVQLSSLMNPHGALVAKALNIPVVWQIVDTRPPFLARKAMLRFISRFADVIMPIGRAVRDAHPGASALGTRCVLFAPPVDLDEFNPAGPASLKQELGLAPDTRCVTAVGNINPQKGHEYFLQAAALVKQRHPDTVFVIVGHLYHQHEQYFKNLQTQALESGLLVGQDVYFLGARTDIPNIMRSSDVLAMASIPNSEGLPTVIVEAMACGVPVVTTDVGSASEAVVQGHTGYVVQSLDFESMASRISDLLGDYECHARFARASRAEAEHRFSLETYGDTHVLAYELANQNRRANRLTP